MTNDARAGERLLGRLGSDEGKGVVQVEDRFDARIEDVWAALTEPRRLARWLGEVEGDLRPGGEFRARYFASGWEGEGRIEVCQPPHRLLVLSRQSGKTDEQPNEATLTADGDGTIFVWEDRGMPVELVAAYGAGIQIHVEDLGAHLAGRERCDANARFDELYPTYQELAAGGS